MSKVITPGLKAVLATRRFFRVDLYEITLSDGVTVLRYCTGDADVTFGGNVFSAGGKTGPYWQKADQRSTLSAKLGLDVDTFEVDVLPGSATVLGIAFNAAAQGGLFDGARFVIYRCPMPTYGDTSNGAPKVFVGIVGQVKPGSRIHFTVNSITVLLNTNLPRNLYSQICINVLGDTACAVSLAPGTFNISGTVSGGSAISVVATMASGKIADFYALGRLILTSGPYSGQSRAIKTSTTTTTVTFGLAIPFPAALAPGTTLRAIAGCNKILGDANGCLKFSNQLNFRGHPYVPTPETAV